VFIKIEYGVVSLMYMARHYEPGHMITLREIVKEELYSAPFVEKILQKLKSSGLVVSSQGNQGGYALAKPPQQINLKQIDGATLSRKYNGFKHLWSKGNHHGYCRHNDGFYLHPGSLDHNN
jgi:Rrf2 family protein